MKRCRPRTYSVKLGTGGDRRGTLVEILTTEEVFGFGLLVDRS